MKCSEILVNLTHNNKTVMDKTKYYEWRRWLIQVIRYEKSFDLLIHIGEYNLFWWRKARQSEVYQYNELIMFERLIFHRKINPQQ